MFSEVVAAAAFSLSIRALIRLASVRQYLIKFNREREQNRHQLKATSNENHILMIQFHWKDLEKFCDDE